MHHFNATVLGADVGRLRCHTEEQFTDCRADSLDDRGCRKPSTQNKKTTYIYHLRKTVDKSRLLMQNVSQ
jgi:hypothetical protein